MQRSFPRTPFKKFILISGLPISLAGNRQARAYIEVFGEGPGDKPFFQKGYPQITSLKAHWYELIMNPYRQYLECLDSQRDLMCDLLSRWSAINSFSRNAEGLDRMLEELEAGFRVLEGTMETVEVYPQKCVESSNESVSAWPGKALRIRKRPGKSPSVFLCCHMDTVFPTDHPLQQPMRESDRILRGPGLADAKGGLLVMLKALETFEQTPWANNMGWEVLINPDEEVGSLGSAPLLAEAAARNDLGLVFEPSFSDGNLVGARKGSGNFTVEVTGRAAHAGREPHLGRNAINALAEFILELNSLLASHAGYLHQCRIHRGRRAGECRTGPGPVQIQRSCNDATRARVLPGASGSHEREDRKQRRYFGVCHWVFHATSKTAR